MTVALIGCGSIGTAWAVTFARAGQLVRAFDPVPAAREQLHAAMRLRLQTLSSFGLLAEDPERVVQRVTLHETMQAAVADAAHIQESGPESLELKRALLSELDAMALPSAVIGSSSSAITASLMSSGLAGEHRILVVHPGNPPYLLPVAEVVPSPATAPDVVERTMALLSEAGMTPVLVRKELEGFVFNRLQGAVLREAYRLVRDGVASAADIDRVMTSGLGRRWSVVGPFATAHLNVRGGITQHAARMGESYRRMGAEHGEGEGWSTELVAQVAEELETLLPVASWDALVQQRDASLMVLEQARQDPRFGVRAQKPSSTTATP